jgi:hypothetical protein
MNKLNVAIGSRRRRKHHETIGTLSLSTLLQEPVVWRSNVTKEVVDTVSQKDEIPSSNYRWAKWANSLI